ncbi:MAG: hypothetical protein WCK31_00510 [bacterium]
MKIKQRLIWVTLIASFTILFVLPIFSPVYAGLSVCNVIDSTSMIKCAKCISCKISDDAKCDTLYELKPGILAGCDLAPATAAPPVAPPAAAVAAAPAQDPGVAGGRSQIKDIPILTPNDICVSDSGKDRNTDDKVATAKATIVYDNCCTCLGGCTKDNANGNTWTAIGCIPGKVSDLATSVTRILFGIGLFLMLVKIIIAGYTLQVSNDPEAIKNSREEIFSIIIGFVVASIGLIILNFIGYDLLGLKSVIQNLDITFPKN